MAWKRRSQSKTSACKQASCCAWQTRYRPGLGRIHFVPADRPSCHNATAHSERALISHCRNCPECALAQPCLPALRVDNVSHYRPTCICRPSSGQQARCCRKNPKFTRQLPRLDPGLPKDGPSLPNLQSMIRQQSKN